MLSTDYVPAVFLYVPSSSWNLKDHLNLTKTSGFLSPRVIGMPRYQFGAHKAASQLVGSKSETDKKPPAVWDPWPSVAAEVRRFPSHNRSSLHRLPPPPLPHSIANLTPNQKSKRVEEAVGGRDAKPDHALMFNTVNSAYCLYFISVFLTRSPATFCW